MKEIVFLTGEDMLDVDLPIVKELNKLNSDIFHFKWVVVLRGYGWFHKEELAAFCEQNNIDNIILECMGKLKSPSTLIFNIKLLRILKKLNPSIIYDSYLGVPHLHFFRSFFLQKKLFVISIHDVVQHYKMKNKMIRTFYYDFLMKTYDNFHIFSNNQLKIFNERFPGKNSFYSPLYLKDFGEVQKQSIIKEKTITNFLFFGIIRANKGLDLLIDAANALGAEYENFHITIAGKCDDWGTYLSSIKRPEQFTFKIENVEKDEVPALFSSAHFLVLPYRDVTQSGVLLTSYNYNVPVIASELEWFEEYVEDGETGYLFENGNADELLNKMKIAIALNSQAYETLSLNLETFISDRINIKDIAKKYISFFKSIN
jgi:glycosyltransferase involved in cell wall biosynthesis